MASMQRAMHSRPGLGTTMHIVQHGRGLLRGVTVMEPALIVVTRGTKTLRRGRRSSVIRSGEAIALAAGETFDMVNTPPLRGGYEAKCLAFSPELIAAAADSAQPGATPIREMRRLGRLPAACLEAMERAAAGLADPKTVPEAIVRQRMREVLVWLQELGGTFCHAAPPSTSERVRVLLAAAPEQAWRACRVGRRLGMSEATLRRRLAAEHTTFGGVLAEVRMTAALALLQATELSILEIASAVGYASPSRFAGRFRLRYGQSPRALRGGHGAQD